MNEFSDSTPTDVVRCPMVPIRDVVVFPYTMVAFVIGRPASVRALEAALRGNKTIFLATQHDATIDEPNVDQVYLVGTIARITHNLRLPDGNITVMVEGLARALPKEPGRRSEKAELEKRKQKTTAAGMAKDAYEKAVPELRRLEQMPPMS